MLLDEDDSTFDSVSSPTLTSLSPDSREEVTKMFFLGDCLLEFYCAVDAEFLRPYFLQEDQKYECGPSEKPLYEEMQKYKPKRFPGGSVQRSAFVAAWIDPQSSVSFAAAVGDDEQHGYIQAQNNRFSSRVSYFFDVIEGGETGAVAALVTSPLNRTLCTKLEASKLFSREFLMRPDVSNYAKEAQLLYSDGVFFSHSPEHITELAGFASAKQMDFAFNLSAEYIVERCYKGIITLLPKFDVLIGGRKEILALYKKMNGDDTDIDVAVRALTDYQLEAGKKIRCVVSTDGPDDVVYSQTNGMVLHYKVPPNENIYDTVGARDAFVGAFLSLWLKKLDLPAAIACGVETANLVLARQGFRLPEDVPEGIQTSFSTAVTSQPVASKFFP